jgi:hypothetical protein
MEYRQPTTATFFPNHISCICCVNVDEPFIVDEYFNNIIFINNPQVRLKTRSHEPQVVHQVASVPNQLAQLQQH